MLYDAPHGADNDDIDDDDHDDAGDDDDDTAPDDDADVPRSMHPSVAVSKSEAAPPGIPKGSPPEQQLTGTGAGTTAKSQMFKMLPAVQAAKVAAEKASADAPKAASSPSPLSSSLPSLSAAGGTGPIHHCHQQLRHHRHHHHQEQQGGTGPTSMHHLQKEAMAPWVASSVSLLSTQASSPAGPGELPQKPGGHGELPFKMPPFKGPPPAKPKAASHTYT